ncbi:MAG: adenosylcobalamin-dependent ribonucleoside-diphosphate reductase [Phycisphaerales bacterium]|nr:MAG: adenosylcobalamin-dependent ribonucleoside-diphosphate reductase [Phycisphaerales bacterium]
MANPRIIEPPGEPPALTDNALAVLEGRYLIRDEHGQPIETPAQLFSRVALLVAEAEADYGAEPARIKQWHRDFYDLMASLRFLPNSPALMNARRAGMLSACFVLPIEDSIEGIFEAIKQTALIQKAGGGTGFSFDRLRPTGDRVASSGGTTSGPISFWRVFSETTNAIQQGAFRRGANMGMMSVTHPDILKFLHAKQNLAAFTNFNISVKITDEWMALALRSSKKLHIVANPRTQQTYLLPRQIDVESYSIDDLHPLTADDKSLSGKTHRFYTVGDIWKMIVFCAHKTGEPGLAFIDRINRDNPTPTLGAIEATNPCGEQPLLPYESCTLGSINLAKFVVADGGPDLDWPALAETVRLAVRFLDNIVDVCDYPVKNTAGLARANRKIGLGLMGFADCLFLLGVPYDSKRGLELGSRIMEFVNDTAHKAGGELAEERAPFPNWEKSVWKTRFNRKMRNAAVTCIAPTGTISMIADCSCGIEPAYSLVFKRHVLDDAELLQIDPVFKQTAQRHGFYTKRLESRIARAGSIQNMAGIPAGIRRIFRCAYDIAPEWHVRMQAAFQQHCDAAVSKTVNLPRNATLATVENAYRLAYRLGCKGITIYRRGTRPHEPMTLY